MIVSEKRRLRARPARNAAAALSTMAATSTDCAGAAGVDDGALGDVVLVAAPAAGAPPLAGVASALVPKIALMILPKMLIVRSL